MIATLTPRLQLLVESICGQGCEHVDEVINALDQQLSAEETKQLDSPEKALVLAALKNIMAVYDQ